VELDDGVNGLEGVPWPSLFAGEWYSISQR
jgi:hypothetical protein